MTKLVEDEVVAEVRRIRDARAKRLDYDIARIVNDARVRQRRSGHRVVSLAKRRKPRPSLRTG